MGYFEHDKLEVYQSAKAFVILANEVIRTLPRGEAHLSDQLRRASTSISLNIAEGSGEFCSPEKNRFYRMARRSTTECAAIIDICFSLQLISEIHFTNSRELLSRIIAMLTKMIKVTEKHKF